MRERLEREAGLDLISTAPNVVYRVDLDDGGEVTVTNPSDWPEGKVGEVYEPVVKCTVIAPSDYIGAIMELCQSRRGVLGGMDYLSDRPRRAALHDAARRDHLRLLRRAEVPHPRLRLAGLRAGRASRPPTW